MSVAKIIEISSESPEGFEDAIQRGIQQAGKITVVAFPVVLIAEEIVARLSCVLE